MFEADGLRQALDTLGLLLADRGLAFEIVAIGGGGLLLLDVIHRPTKDLDAVALVKDGAYQGARPLPPPLLDAIRDTALALGLPDDWLDAGPTDQLRHGLPAGFAARTTQLVFGGLTLQVASRFDQVCLKLYAAADDGPRSKHVQDLIALAPSDDELARAAGWVKQQDASAEFQAFVDQVIAHVIGALRETP